MVQYNPIPKYLRYLAKARELLESTKRENYSRDIDYRRVVTLRRHKVRHLEKLIERLKERYGEEG